MKISLIAGCFPVVLGACTAPPTPLPDVTALQATALQASIQQPRNQSVVRNYENRTVTDPKPWRELNDAQSTEGDHS